MEGLHGKDVPKFRIIVLGASEVGKTSLILQYLNNTFKEKYYPTKEIT